jgi:hypothetical protein
MGTAMNATILRRRVRRIEQNQRPYTLPVSSLLLWIKVALLIAAAFLIRPTALGEEYTILGLGLGAVALSIHGLDSLLHGKSRINKKSSIVMVMVFVLWIYLVLQSLALQSQGSEYVIRSAAANMITILVYGLVLGDIRTNRVFFRGLVVVLSLLSASILITYLLMLVVPLTLLQIGTISVETYTEGQFINYGDIYLPLSMSYGFYPFGGVEVPRFTGFLREPGILQAFLLWAAVYVLNERLPRVLLLPLLLGVVASLSTAGITLLPATLFLWIVSKAHISKISKAAMVSAGGTIALLALVYAPGVGILDKNETHGDSFEGRVDATVTGLQLMLEHLMGIGLYSGTLIENAGINLLAATGQIGVLGFALAAMIFVAPIVSSSNPGSYMVAIFPVFVTSLVSQPLVDAPLVYVLLLATFAPVARSKRSMSYTKA